jgi:hypothetical protein
MDVALMMLEKKGKRTMLAVDAKMRLFHLC